MRRLFILLTVCTLILTGCSGQKEQPITESQSVETTSQVEESESTETVETEDVQYEATTIQNARQKAEVSVVKQDSETENPLDGGKYTLYAGNDIKNYAGQVIVTKGTALQTVTTGEDIRLLLSQKPNDYPEIRIMLRELINEVNAIGNNINQITRNHNSKLYREEDRQLLSAYMKKLNLLVKEAVETIGNQ